MGLLDRIRAKPAAPEGKDSPAAAMPPLIYSWVITGRLAIGPMPRSEAHWQQLTAAGLRSRFSCCYPEEEIYTPPPQDWLQGGVCLPDHRRQEPLRPERLVEALSLAQQIIETQPATYLHCMAGMERSPLIAVGLLARERKIDVLGALEAIRLCHPMAQPIFSDLDLLEQVLKG
jgi:hypothetical protein